jgi:hypothetical protein
MCEDVHISQVCNTWQIYYVVIILHLTDNTDKTGKIPYIVSLFLVRT